MMLPIPSQEWKMRHENLEILSVELVVQIQVVTFPNNSHESSLLLEFAAGSQFLVVIPPHQHFLAIDALQVFTHVFGMTETDVTGNDQSVILSDHRIQSVDNSAIHFTDGSEMAT